MEEESEIHLLYQLPIEMIKRIYHYLDKCSKLAFHMSLSYLNQRTESVIFESDQPSFSKLASYKGYLGLLKWAIEANLPSQSSDDWKHAIGFGAAKGGHMFICKWAEEQGYPLHDGILMDAASSGSLDILKWGLYTRDL